MSTSLKIVLSLGLVAFLAACSGQDEKMSDSSMAVSQDKAMRKSK